MSKIIGVLSIIAATVFMNVACSNPKEIKDKQYYSEGLYLYQKYCQNCHMDSGKGLGELIPPLAGSDYLTKHTNQIACLIKNGKRNKMLVNGKEYDGIMPGNNLSTIEIAEIITYITNSWGNKLPTYSINQVELDLKKCQ
ncbi:c-type cytochrome [Solitalea lacus]|uniref:c-type cytochrome n=1 Tax=Solitalea lacus TaxID=2911172 RepID=UPI001EDC59DE|nr:cytochrome c [Solitalea lacus]UKJ05959.1 cytochrome c [Solitalea lacus]